MLLHDTDVPPVSPFYLSYNVLAQTANPVLLASYLQIIPEYLRPVYKFSKLAQYTLPKICFSTCIDLSGCTTTSVCRPPCPPCLPWVPARRSVPVLPPTLVVTERAETELTPKAPEPTLLHLPQSSVSNVHCYMIQETKDSIKYCTLYRMVLV